MVSEGEVDGATAETDCARVSTGPKNAGMQAEILGRASRAGTPFLRGRGSVTCLSFDCRDCLQVAPSLARLLLEVKKNGYTEGNVMSLRSFSLPEGAGDWAGPSSFSNMTSETLFNRVDPACPRSRCVPGDRGARLGL